MNFNALVPDLDLQTLDTFADKRCSKAATSPSGSQSTQAAPLQAFDQAAAEANEFASGNEKRPVLQLSPPSGGETAQQLQEQCVGSLPQHVSSRRKSQQEPSTSGSARSWVQRLLQVGPFRHCMHPSRILCLLLCMAALGSFMLRAWLLSKMFCRLAEDMAGVPT